VSSTDHDRTPRTVFLTGATGFLGAFLLDELLSKTDLTVYALVRAGDAGDGIRRLRSAMTEWNLDVDRLSGRVVPVPGDLSKPLLGMSEDMFGRIAEEADAVYHSGAHVNFAYPYAALKAANVDGTKEVVRLCVRDHVKRLHHISAIDAMVQKGTRAVYEDEPLPERPIPHGYVQSKWAAERVVAAAEERGLPVTVYRPWLTGAHSRTGACHTTDYVLRLLRACLDVGIVPDYEEPLNITPVDFFARSVVHISQRDDTVGQRFHFANPRDTPLPDIYTWIRSYGYDVDVLPFHTWRDRLVREVPPTSPGYSVLPLIPQHPATEENRHPRIDLTRTLETVRDAGISCAPLDERMLHLELDYLTNAGFLERPAGRALATAGTTTYGG
jgi:myxalamid-type nonribosomal peptide synthetase MxaA